MGTSTEAQGAQVTEMLSLLKEQAGYYTPAFWRQKHSFRQPYASDTENSKFNVSALQIWSLPSYPRSIDTNKVKEMLCEGSGMPVRQGPTDWTSMQRRPQVGREHRQLESCGPCRCTSYM